MAIDQLDRTVVADEPVAVGDQGTMPASARRVPSYGPGAAEQTRRVVVLLFGLVQILIGARFVLLLLDAREANVLVSSILNMSQLFVAPFEGILRTNSLHAAGSVLDMTAVVAFIGWTLVELIVLWAVGIFSRDHANAAA